MLRMAATIMGSNIQAHCLRPCPPSKCSSTRRRSFSGLGRRSRPSTSSLGFEFAPYSGCASVEREVYFAAIGGEQVDHVVASFGARGDEWVEYRQPCDLRPVAGPSAALLASSGSPQKQLSWVCSSWSGWSGGCGKRHDRPRARSSPYKGGTRLAMSDALGVLGLKPFLGMILVVVWVLSGAASRYDQRKK